MAPSPTEQGAEAQGAVSQVDILQALLSVSAELTQCIYVACYGSNSSNTSKCTDRRRIAQHADGVWGAGGDKWWHGL